jgi:N-acetyl-gamma-glutamyl-phosphate reductase
MIKVGIVGGTGYTGVELLRFLVQHPQVQIQTVTSRTEVGMPIAEFFPNLRGYTNLTFSEPNLDDLISCDIVFFCNTQWHCHAYGT